MTEVNETSYAELMALSDELYKALQRIGLIVAWGGDEKSARIRELVRAALAAGSGTAETNVDLAQCEASQSGPKGNAQGSIA